MNGSTAAAGQECTIPSQPSFRNELFDSALFIVANNVPLEASTFRKLKIAIEQSGFSYKDKPFRPLGGIDQIAPNLVAAGVNEKFIVRERLSLGRTKAVRQ